jgi:hypothetical protein
MSASIATHSDPVWRLRSDFIVAAKINPGETDVEREQLWARRVDESHVELCCIPFFLYDVALGDILVVDAELLYQSVVERSGRYVFRAWFGESTYPAEAMETGLLEVGALFEWSSKNLVAIDARDVNHAEVVADFLQDLQDRGELVFETGKMFSAD